DSSSSIALSTAEFEYLESLFQSNIFDNNYSNSAVDRAMELLESSVQSTGILPLLLYHRNDLTKEGVDISGLGGKKQQLPFQGSKLSIGREDMHFLRYNHKPLKIPV